MQPPSFPSGTLVGELGPRFDDVRQIAVLRGGGIGDLMFVLPAVESLAAAYPKAEIVLLGMPSHAALLAGRPAPFSAVEVLPVHPGVREGSPVDPAVTDAFVARVRARRLDLAVQAHGGGGNSNPFLLRLGARHTVGTVAPGATRLERDLPYRYFQHETQRWLEVAALAGAPAVQLEAQLRGRAGRRPRPGAAPRLVVHPGATDPRRRWPAGRFATVAATVAQRGVEVVVVGDASDSEAADAILAHAQSPLVTSVADRISLPALVDLLEDSDVVLANDSGPRHVAMAVGTATVGVFWGPNMINAAPVARRRHRVLPGWVLDCPRCGAPLAQGDELRCDHEESWVADVAVEPVLADVLDLLQTPRDPA
ncbi:MAG: glycosyltransferase family 9 protein [Janthinobacterium lividum]